MLGGVLTLSVRACQPSGDAAIWPTMKPERRFSRDAILGATEALASQSRPVRFQDVDAAGTIFFPKVYEYFSDAYLDLLLAAGLDVPGSLARRESAAPLVHSEAAPLR